MQLLSAERVRRLAAAKPRPTSVSELASGLKRDTRSVVRDVDLLESFGVLQTHYEVNPGHGRRRMVEPRATSWWRTYKLVIRFEARGRAAQLFGRT